MSKQPYPVIQVLIHEEREGISLYFLSLILLLQEKDDFPIHEDNSQFFLYFYATSKGVGSKGHRWPVNPLFY